MSVQRPVDKILSFSSRERGTRSDVQRERKAIHPMVRRRRILWFSGMVVFVVWFLVSVVIQQFRIWNYQERLYVKQHQMEEAEKKTAQLEQAMKKLQREEYLFELAHKMGYSYPGEENYEVKAKR